MIKAVFKFCVFCVGLFIIGTTCANIWTYITTESYIYSYGQLSEVPVAEVALVPGAAIWQDGNMSPIFQDRVDTAIALYEAGKVTKILVSGDNGTMTYNEVDPAREYLISKGIPPENIFLDYAGFDTYSTMYRARDIFEVSTAIIVTQRFHLPRSVFIANTLGMNVHGVSASTGSVRFRNYVREIFATDKAVFDVIVNRLPKFLGDKIPISTAS